MNAAQQDEGLWARSDVLPDGTYGVAITVETDTAFSLDREQAIAYAVACMRRATEADHSTAVMRLLTGRVGLPAEDAREVVLGMAGPPDLDTKPIEFTPVIVRARHPRPDAGAFLPMLRMEVDGRDTGELTPSDLRDHGTGVLNILAATTLDNRFHELLTTKLNLEDGTARAIVADLFNHWPEGRAPRNWLGDDG